MNKHENMGLITIDGMCVRLFNSLQNEGELENNFFTKLTRNSDRVKVATHFLKRYNLLPEKELLEDESQNKSVEKSLELRNSGNKAFMKKDDKGALLLYTKSIAAAPFPINVDLAKDENADHALAIALANRSAVLFSIGKHELCLRDISLALKYNYPKKLLYKLYERQAKCLQYLGRKEEATESINNGLKWLPSATELTQDKKQTIEAELQKLLKYVKSVKASAELPRHELPQLPTCSYNKNQNIPCASDCVEVKYSPEMGRCISATRDIKPGDVLAVEKPFASVLYPEKFETHCYNCLQRCEALLPCCFCSNVMYCSDECRTSSWEKSHFIDCSILPIFQKLNICKRYFLSLKIVIMVCKNKDLKNLFASLEAEKNLEERNKGFNSEGHYSSSDYSPIYWLMPHTEKRDISDLLSKSVLAACILHCLEIFSDFFSDININQFKYEVGGLLLRHVQNLPCNGHEVVECIKINAKDVKGQVPHVELHMIGVAAYAMLSLLNHSCDPNVDRMNHRGDITVLHAARPIPAGEQVFDNYVPSHAILGKEERRTQLESNYYFTCRCIACVEDWPTYELLPVEPTFICSRCKHVLQVLPNWMSRYTATCVSCNNIYNPARTFSRILTSAGEYQYSCKQLFEEDVTNKNEAVQKMREHLLLLDENFKRPFKEYAECQETIKQYLVTTGNLYKP